MSFRQLGCIVAALLKCDFHLAAEETRILTILIHDDVVQIVVAMEKLLSLWRAPTKAMDRILIVKLDRIGDMVNTTPVFDALRSGFPNARLDIVGHPTSLSLLEGDDRIAERIPYKSWLYHALPVVPPGLNSWMLISRLLRQRYPLVVYLRGSFPFLLLGMTSRLAAAKFVAGEPVIERYLKPIESLCGSIPQRVPRLYTSDENLSCARELLFGRNAHDGPRIAIHAAAVVTSKVWPVEDFAAVADDLHKMFNAQVHFFGSPDDRVVLESISRRSTYGHSFHLSCSLPQVAAAISLCDLFIGNDSGLSHVAAAVGTPEIILWGPANLTMARPKAPAERSVILYRDVPCRSVCPEIRCVNPIELECLKKIRPSDVVQAAKRFLNEFSHPSGDCGPSVHWANI